MSDWSSFEKDKRLTDSWRSFLTEKASARQIQTFVGVPKKAKATPEAEMAPDWYGVVMADDSTLVGVSGAPMTATTSGAEPEAPASTGTTGTTPPKPTTPPVVTTEVAIGLAAEKAEEEKPADADVEPEEPKKEFPDQERILYGPEGLQEEWNKLGRETKKVDPVSFAEVPYQKEGGKITRSGNEKLMELFKTEFREFFSAREQIALRLDEKEEKDEWSPEKDIEYTKDAEAYTKTAEEDKALMSAEGFFEAVETNPRGWYFKDLRTPPKEEKPPPPEEVIPGRFVVVNLPIKAEKSMVAQWKRAGHSAEGFIPALNKFAAFVGPFIEPTRSKLAGDKRYQDKKKLAARRAELQKQIFEGLRRMLLIYEAKNPMTRVIDTDYLRGSAAEMTRKFNQIRTESPGTARDIYNIANLFIGDTKTVSSAEKGSYRRRALLDVIYSIRWYGQDPNPIEKYAAENPSVSKDTGEAPMGPGKIAAPGKPGAQGPTGGLAFKGKGQAGKGAYSRQKSKSTQRARTRGTGATSTTYAGGSGREGQTIRGVQKEQQALDRWKLLAGIKKEVI